MRERGTVTMSMENRTDVVPEVENGMNVQNGTVEIPDVYSTITATPSVQTRLAKIIAVWGDNGITTLSTALASELAQSGKQVLLINTNKIVPANAIWHINEPVPKEKSIINLLRNEEITSSTIARYFAIDSKGQTNIATLAYCDGDNILIGNEEAPYSTYVQLLKSAQSIVDYIIIDCSKEISDMMTLAAFQFADLQVIALTPDARGVQFYKANVPLLSNEQFNNCKRIYLANLSTNDNDVYAFGDVIHNEICAVLPTDDGIRKSVALGDYLNVSKYTGHRYNKGLRKLLSVVTGNLSFDNETEPKKRKTKEKRKKKE